MIYENIQRAKKNAERFTTDGNQNKSHNLSYKRMNDFKLFNKFLRKIAMKFELCMATFRNNEFSYASRIENIHSSIPLINVIHFISISTFINTSSIHRVRDET